MSKPNAQTPRRYPPELRARAVRMVKEGIAQAGGQRHGAVTGFDRSARCLTKLLGSGMSWYSGKARTFLRYICVLRRLVVSRCTVSTIN
jgi:hypothetical protein